MEKAQWSGAPTVRRVRRIVQGLALILVALFLAMWLKPSNPVIEVLRADLDGNPWVNAAMLVGAMGLFAALLQLERVLGALERGFPFTRKIVTGFYRFAALASGSMFIVVAAPTLGSLTSLVPHGVAITLRMIDVLLLVICLSFFAVAALIAEAMRIDRDNRSIV